MSHTYMHIISNAIIIKSISIESIVFKRKSGEDNYT